MVYKPSTARLNNNTMAHNENTYRYDSDLYSAMAQGMGQFQLDTAPNEETILRTLSMPTTPDDHEAARRLAETVATPDGQYVSAFTTTSTRAAMRGDLSTRRQLVSLTSGALTGPEVSMEARVDPNHEHHCRLQEQIQRHKSEMEQIASTAHFEAMHVQAGSIMAQAIQQETDRESAAALHARMIQQAQDQTNMDHLEFLQTRACREEKVLSTPTWCTKKEQNMES